MKVRDEPELQHTLAHMWLAIDAIASGRKASALYHLAVVEDSVFWDSDDHLEKDMAHRPCHKRPKPKPKKKPKKR